MGMSTITAGRIYKGQQKGQPGEEENLTFDEFPHTGLAKVCVVKNAPRFFNEFCIFIDLQHR